MKPIDKTLHKMTRNNSRAIITVGILQDGQASYTVYGENAAVLPRVEHVYEIGSVTKTFVGSLLIKAIGERKIALDDRMGKYLDLPPGAYDPTIRRLVTHTAGYRSLYKVPELKENTTERGLAVFCGVTREMLLKRAGMVRLKDRDHPFRYSNYGFSLLGAVLEEAYGTGFTALMNEYARELGLANTMIADGSGDLGRYLPWREDSAIMPAGALSSTVGDMLEYARMHMEGRPAYLRETHRPLLTRTGSLSLMALLNIRADAVGAAWMIDVKHNVIWHNGATADHNCHLGFDPDRRIAVVMLTNLRAGLRTAATVPAARLLLDMQQ